VTKPARQKTTTAPAPTLAQTAATAMAHALFPLISGLWFAALFGLGAVVAGGEALAALAGHLHLTTIIPSAAPPLGTHAHILIAAGLTAVGAVFGLVLGLLLRARATGSALFDGSLIKAGLARARAAKPAPREAAVPVESAPTPTPRVRNRDAHPDAPPRRPLVVTEDVLPYHAPIDAREPAEPVTAPPAWTAEVIDPELGADFIQAPLGTFMTGHPAAEDTAHPAEVPLFLAGNFGDAPPLAASGIYGSGEPIVLPPETGVPADLAHAQPATFHDDAAPVFVPAFHTGPMPLASQAAVAPREPIVESPVDSLGLVQLIERLALAITVRQAKRAALGYRTVPAPHDVADESEAPLLRVKPSRLGRVNDAVVAPVSEEVPVGNGALPRSLHDPLAHIDLAHQDWTDAADHAVPARFLRNPVEPSAPETTDLAEEDTFVAPHSIFGAVKSDAAEPQYSSLVNMTMARARLSDGPDSEGAYSNDPVVKFPAPSGDQAQHPADQADRALRDALATLRRMSAQR